MKKRVVFLWLLLAFIAPSWGQIKLAVLEPEGKGLSKDEQWMLSLVQSSIAGDLNKYSDGAITIIDRQNLEAIIAEQKRSLSAMTSDEAIRIGNLANASHILVGKITKTPKAFMLDLAVTDVETGVRKASHSPKSVTASSLEDLSALKAASADLLKQLGVNLTDSQLAELKGPVAETQVQAQTALARGVVAQRQGTNVTALSYYYQAASFDPTLVEAVSRSSVVSANISGANLGDNIRNDIAWRKKWVEQLKETEETFYRIINSAPPPYKLFYSTAIETKNINYQTETADLSIPLHLLANMEWFNAMQRALKAAQAVMDGLNETNRKKDWGLERWPEQGVSNTNPFALQKEYDIPVEFELVNQKGKVIGKQKTKLEPFFNIDNNLIFKFTLKTSNILTFNAVNANEISDNLTIRLTSVNGASPKNAKFPITAISTKEPPQNPIKWMSFTDSRDGKKYKAVEIGGIWMAENLNYDASGSKCYKNQESNCQKYGRLYDWNTAMKVCPQGWHLPSEKEWQTLVGFAGGDKAGTRLKAMSGWNGNGTDDFDFSALPGGYGYSSGSFDNVGDRSYWWSATEYDASTAYYWDMKYNGTFVRSYDYGKTRLYSVRCVQD